MASANKAPNTSDYLQLIGVSDLPPLTTPFDPGYDACTVESHLDQSAHLMAGLKISMACWIIADEKATRRKVEAARAHHVPACTGGGPFEIAVAQGQLEAYLDLCADIGVSRIECGEGFTELRCKPREIFRLAQERGMDIQYEMGRNTKGPLAPTRSKTRLQEGMPGWMPGRWSWLSKQEKAPLE